MSELERLKGQFVHPPAEFSPVPFWFWNDELQKEELIRQIHDFHAKEVGGFVIHPRMGMPHTMPYLSEAYLDMVEAAVAEAERLGMRVILYDEGMYPSGSACGMVVRQNPNYASRGLELREYPCEASGSSERIPFTLLPGETLVSAQAVRKLSAGAYDAGSVRVLDYEKDGLAFTPPDAGSWSILLFIETPSYGTIRGVHQGQDDGEPDAPLAADLLNPDAVQAFISLTHEKYYGRLSRYFGTTIFAMFTDEPDLLGRGHKKGIKPWTRGFMDEFLAGGCREEELPSLWFHAGDTAARVREAYEAMIRNRMARTYYKPLADWCEAHGISLTGHPAGSDDIGLLHHFHIPGQDVVWWFIAPEGDKALAGVHSTMGKCSSDAARHLGRRRNLNECFGVCGAEGGWSLSADNMKWYLDWLFVRGVNLISPHAFYYSIRGERRDERPPDVGPHNIWWPEYAAFSRYIKRMSWLMTDSINSARVAVMAGEAFLPWQIVRPLYESQVEFNYLEEGLLADSSCRIKDGTIEIAGYRYSAVLIEEGHRLSPAAWNRLETFAAQGGFVIELAEAGRTATDIGQIVVQNETHIPDLLNGRLGRPFALDPAAASIRISRVEKNGIYFYVMTNEGEAAYEGALQLSDSNSGLTECWRPWSGACSPAKMEHSEAGKRVPIHIERRECLIVAVDPSRGHINREEAQVHKTLLTDLSEGWRVVEGPMLGDLKELTSWTEWGDMNRYSGTVSYEKSFELDLSSGHTEWQLDLGDVHELARLWVNGTEAGVRMWKPYVFDIGRHVQQGTNVLRVSVTNSLANRYDGQSFPSGLIGPVRLLG
ncbi:hypothetical protein D3P08_05055 [Paenibacillus nanensis]|uniref:Uncharacterized protein n=1 Tax=Paenibacillus nanensis TaxID=393251 RepID=A0A3A1VGX9_9BACL|nr:glycosylhydrolase-like jelly roll fold domain-containing protein [Paenibacillus nanensis]RIX59515.1 hypothetical protein D3P08_05055 [Paenibacillus nanensis]